jgi:hypothetical protein
MRKSDSTLHFYLNGVDLGVAATEIPEVVFGVVDLYGAAIKTTVCGDDLPVPVISEDGGNEATNVPADNPCKFYSYCRVTLCGKVKVRELLFNNGSYFS